MFILIQDSIINTDSISIISKTENSIEVELNNELEEKRMFYYDSKIERDEAFARIEYAMKV